MNSVSIFKSISLSLIICMIASLSISNSAYARRKTKKNEIAKVCTISKDVVDTIASNDINASVIALRNNPDCPKRLYLLREVTRIARFDMDQKPKRHEAHKVYQNLAIAYHNLYLFLKTQGIEQRDFFENAQRYYKKARRAGTTLHKEECDLLSAAITAASGNMKKAEKLFSKVEESMLRGDFESTEYLAAYYGASGDINNAVISLNEAYRLNPERTVAWIEIGDDFYNIKSDPRFIAMARSFKVSGTDNTISLSVPSSKQPQLELKDSGSYFMKSGDMPKYKKKR
ncbi:MAG: hypothetical protein HN337_06340 [Deltaproteobacteria bacterium]|nr:hypothetical protein [Deltaproteobacteria bacterium]